MVVAGTLVRARLALAASDGARAELCHDPCDDDPPPPHPRDDGKRRRR